jgi:iron complex transport system permease protein
MADVALSTPLAIPRPHGPRYGIYYLAIAVVAAILFLLELGIGSVYIPLSEVVTILTGGAASRDVWEPIVLQFRFPRALNAAVSGAALGVCGLLLQTLFRNPLADPYVLGIVHGGRFGVACLVVAMGAAGDALIRKLGPFGDVGLALAAALGSCAAIGFLMIIARRVSTVTLLIVGLMIGYLSIGLISVVLHFTDETQARVFQSWDDGSFAGITASQLRLLLPIVLAGVAVAHFLMKPLNALLLGESYARTLGLSIEKARMAAFAVTAALVGTVTAYCGPIAFLGIVTAHLCRLLFRTSDHRILMPAVVLMGPALALAADLVTHLPWSKHVFHLNAVNGLVGAPIVLWVLLTRKNARSLEL